MADYQAIVEELVFLYSAQLQVAQFCGSPQSAPVVDQLWESPRLTVEKCRESVQRFKDSIRKYNAALSVAGSGNTFRHPGVYSALSLMYKSITLSVYVVSDT